MSETPKKELTVQPAPSLRPNAHKGRAGHLLCFAGSSTMPGAPILIVRAAQRAGAGLVTLAVFEREMVAAVAVASPETIYLDLSRAKDDLAKGLAAALKHREDQVRVVGPGLGRTHRTADLVWYLIEDEFASPMVFDADALQAVGTDIAAFARRVAPTVLTPHPGEAARLLGVNRIPEEEEGRIECALEIARFSESICVLKGHRTIVTDGKRMYVNESGNPGMATAGSGDVLAGIIGAYLCSVVLQGSEAWGNFDAVCTAVHLHGLAGDLAAEEIGERAVIASSMIDYLPAAQLRQAGERSE
jgi:hydroxyethylthiazole kinase-like uncharacterized protein yjeF